MLPSGFDGGIFIFNLLYFGNIMRWEPLVLIAIAGAGACVAASKVRLSPPPPPLREGMLHRELVTIFEKKGNPDKLYCSYNNSLPAGGILLTSDPKSNVAVPSSGSVLVTIDKKDGKFSLFQRVSTELMLQATVDPQGLSNQNVLYNNGSNSLKSLDVAEGSMLNNRQVIALLQACSKNGKTH